jgi:hypothetical protein
MPKRKVREFSYAETFDTAMAEAFPGKAYETYWNICSGSWGGYTTVRLEGDDRKWLTKREWEVGRAISNAITAARVGVEG